MPPSDSQLIEQIIAIAKSITAFRTLFPGVISPRTWLATGLFLGGLALLLAVTLVAVRWWTRRQPRRSGDAVQTVARNASIPFAIQLMTRAIDLGFAFLLYRFVVAGAVGAYEFAGLLVVQYLGTLADWGLTVLATREIARDHASAPLYFRTTLRLRLRFALLCLPAAALFVGGYNGLAVAGLITERLDQRTITLIAILVLTLFPAALSAATTALFQATERLEVPAVINLLTNIVSAVARVGALALGFGVVGVAGGALFGALVGAALFGLALRRGFGDLTLRGPVLPARPLLREGWPLLLNSLLIGVFFRFDAFIIMAFHGEATLAIYNVAYKFINLTQIIPPVVINAVFPLLSRRAASDRAGMSRAFAGTLRLLIMLALPLAVGFTALATPLAQAMADKPEYLPGSAYALAITIWYLPFSFINGLTQYVVIALGRQRVITLAFGLTALFNVALNLLLVPRYSFIAAGAITVASELVLFLPLRRVLRQEGINTALPTLFWRPALAALAMGGAVWAAHQIHVVAAVAVAAPVYAGMLWLLGGFGEAERDLFRRALRRG
ncbi:MAG: flippase [Herpetosiphonaceae bacterium]|nr:flippase [Herpetosiphonaceae bacterium]